MVKKMQQYQQRNSKHPIRKSTETSSSNTNTLTHQHCLNDNEIPHDTTNLSMHERINESQIQKQIKTKHQPAYRITSYPIQNKTYRLVSLNEEVERNQGDNGDNQLNHRHQNNVFNLQDDFRQPLNNIFPPRRNPIARHRHHRRRNQQSSYLRYWQKLNPFSRNKKPYNQSLFSYLKKLFIYVKSVELSSWLQYIPFIHLSPTLESKYKYTSMAILNNSINLEAAVIKALQYNIPMMQVIMNERNPEQEIFVREKILKNFSIAHFINQNFVLYGDWGYEKYKEIFQKQQNKLYGLKIGNQQNGGKIVFRKGEIVFAQIDIAYVNLIDHNQLQEKLQEIRNHFYRTKQLYRNPNSLISSEQTVLLGEQNKKVQQKKKQNNDPIIEQNQQRNYEQGSNGPINRKIPTIKQIEQQILQDYLLERRVQEIFEKQRKDIFNQELQEIQQIQQKHRYQNQQIRNISHLYHNVTLQNNFHDIQGSLTLSNRIEYKNTKQEIYVDEENEKQQEEQKEQKNNRPMIEDLE